MEEKRRKLLPISGVAVYLLGWWMGGVLDRYLARRMGDPNC